MRGGMEMVFWSKGQKVKLAVEKGELLKGGRQRKTKASLSLCSPISEQWLWSIFLPAWFHPYQVLVSEKTQAFVCLGQAGSYRSSEVVLSMFNADGLQKKCSLSEVLYFLPRDSRRFDRIQNQYTHGAGSSWWLENSYFVLKDINKKECLVIWLDWADQWLAWTVPHGEKLVLKASNITALNQHLMQKSREQVDFFLEKKKELHQIKPFLTYLVANEDLKDKVRMDLLLNLKDFKIKLRLNDHVNGKRKTAYIESPARNFLDQLMMKKINNWDSPKSRNEQFLFGGLNGVLQLPDDWQELQFKLTKASDENYFFLNRKELDSLNSEGMNEDTELYFQISGLHPGEYMLMVSETLYGEGEKASPGLNTIKVQVTAGKAVALKHLLKIRTKPVHDYGLHELQE